jgi:hypothetical protein
LERQQHKHNSTGTKNDLDQVDWLNRLKI